MTLYNLKFADGQWRITKFTNDLEVESSYITSINECECPAGNRPTCRHRQMLPKMLNVGAEDSGMFYDFERDQFLELITDPEDTQPVIVSPMEDELEDEPELPPQAAQDILSPPEPASFRQIHDGVVSPEMAKMIEAVHPALNGPLRRRI